MRFRASTPLKVRLPPLLAALPHGAVDHELICELPDSAVVFDMLPFQRCVKAGSSLSPPSPAPPRKRYVGGDIP